MRRGRALERTGIVQRVAPFAAAAVLAFATVPLPPGNTETIALVGAAALTAAIILAALVAPWHRLPAWLQVAPPLAYVGVVALLRHAEGGATSGYAMLLMLPVFWLALYGTRLQVLLAAVAAGLALLVPIVWFGEPGYPASEWRRLIIWLSIVPVVGFTVSALVETVDRLARTDALTGVANRRAWDEEVELMLARARRYGTTMSVAIIDLDHFKRFNDAHGHPAGDHLLAQAGPSWTACLRATDVIARYGGEEFGVLLPDTPGAEAVVVLERVRAATPEGQTVSVGIAQWDGHEPLANLIDRADGALYQAKNEGRNRTVLAEVAASAPATPYEPTPQAGHEAGAGA